MLVKQFHQKMWAKIFLMWTLNHQFRIKNQGTQWRVGEDVFSFNFSLFHHLPGLSTDCRRFLFFTDALQVVLSALKSEISLTKDDRNIKTKMRQLYQFEKICFSRFYEPQDLLCVVTSHWSRVDVMLRRIDSFEDCSGAFRWIICSLVAVPQVSRSMLLS